MIRSTIFIVIISIMLAIIISMLVLIILLKKYITDILRGTTIYFFGRIINIINYYY